ncbi:MAG: hypothetical protein R2854_20025 [Caldilineaceae bacterium]
MSDINRIPTAGGLERTIFSQDVSSIACGQWAPEILSNVVFDTEFAYWMSSADDGLVKLSVEANDGDAPTLVYGGQNDADAIVERGDYVWLMDDAYGIVRVHKETGAAQQITSVAQLGGPAQDLQVDEDYLYWNQNGFLKFQTANGGPGSGIATGVTGYVPDFLLCLPSNCSEDYVLVAQQDTIRRYAINAAEFSPVLYDSAFDGAVVEEIASDLFHIYFWERRTATCEPFCTYNYVLQRMPKGGGPAEVIYFIEGDQFGVQHFDLTLGGPDGGYLFWTDNGRLKRLPRDAEALTSVDVAVTNVEVTQSIQDLSNSVDLIREKRTGVRVHVDAAGQNVPGITARLYRINGSGSVIDGPISPSSGTQYLTIQDNPNRATFDHAFYFALPADWVDDATLRLRAEVNPNQLPPEPNFANNVQDTPTFNLLSSPTLRTHLVVWGYTAGGTYYQPDTIQEVYQARSWIRRTYPVASNTGGFNSAEPGFRLDTRVINDGNLGGHVLRTSDFCLDIPAKNREFCAANYMNSCAKWLRATEGIPNDQLIYSMIWNASPTLPFPRGRASGSVSAGPTGPQSWGWDNDGSSGDWYMGHEVGHNAGRNHPTPAGDDPNTEVREGCGHSRSDNSFPYANAAIGNGSMWGFDVGDVGLNSALTPRVYPNNTWRDMMSYCDNQWISDYTYEGIYNFLSSATAAGANTVQAVHAGDAYIALFGTIYTEDAVGTFDVVGLWDSAGPYAAPTSGPFRMVFLDGGGSELAGYDFDGEATDTDPTNLAYEVVVPFPAGTQQIRMVRTGDGAVLATHTLSANPPTIGNVALVGATEPVSGTVTLTWQADDADGDALMYDVFYTDDNGASYTAYALALSEPTVQLDTTQMAGSNQARFRVIANDGTRTAEAESATFTMASKPPTVFILTPQDGVEVRYGTQVNLLAEVEDLQGDVPDGSMTWFVNGASTGINGPSYTAYLLPVGTNEVSLRATNVNGQTTTRGVTVIVNDEVGYPGPLLAVGPDQLHWQLPAGATATEQATLDISNIGTGNLTWTAAEDADWLSLDATAGTTPGALTVTVDPAQAPADTPLNDHHHQRRQRADHGTAGERAGRCVAGVGRRRGLAIRSSWRSTCPSFWTSRIGVRCA